MSDARNIEAQLAALYQANRRDIYFYLLRQTRNSESALDLVQDAFVNFCSYYAQRPLPPEDQCRMILFRIARNLLISATRTFDENRVQADERLDEHPAGESPVMADLEAGEVQALLDRLLARIEAKYREALLLRYDQDLSLAEMAVVLEVSLSAVSRRIKKAEAALLAQSRRDNVNLALYLSLVVLLTRGDLAVPRI